MPTGIDVRYCQTRDLLDPKPQWPARQYVWIKALSPLPDAPDVHQSVIAYCSDRVLLGTAYYPYPLLGFHARIKLQTSLDHSIWFHDDFSAEKTDELDRSQQIQRSSDMPAIPSKVPIRADDWLLYEVECPVHRNHRAWALCRVWTRHGRHIATCTQEGLIRSR